MSTEMWCIINNNATPNDAHVDLKSDPHKMGTSHDDGENQIHSNLPKPEYLIGVERKLVWSTDESLTDEQRVLDLVGQAGQSMVSNSSDVLTGTRSMISMLFRTPQHRIWMNKWTTDGVFDTTSYEAAFVSTFGQASQGVTSTQAKAMIKAHFGGS